MVSKELGEHKNVVISCPCRLTINMPIEGRPKLCHYCGRGYKATVTNGRVTIKMVERYSDEWKEYNNFQLGD